MIGDFSVYDTTLTANTISNARQLYENIINAENIYFPKEMSSEWIKYDGSFYFTVDLKYRQNNNISVFNKIKTRFKDKTFALNYITGDFYRHWGEIYCDSTFYKEIKIDIPKWDNYQFSILNTWKPWNLEERNYSLFIFTEDKNKLDEFIKNATKK